MAGLLDEYMPTPLEPSEEELRRARMLAIARVGLGMSGREPMGSAAMGGINTYMDAINQARNDARQRALMQQQQMQMAIQLRKQAALEGAAKNFDPAQAIAAGISPQEIAYAKANPEYLAEIFKKMAPMKMSQGDNVYVPGIGIIDGAPDKDGFVNVIDPQTGRAIGRKKLSGQTEAVAREAYAVQAGQEQAKAQADLVPYPDGRGGTTMISRAAALERSGTPLPGSQPTPALAAPVSAQPQVGMAAGVTAQNPVIPPQVQAAVDAGPRMAILKAELQKEMAAGNATNVAALQTEIAQLQGKLAANIPRAGRPGYTPPKPGEGYQWAPGQEGVRQEPIPGGSADTSIKESMNVKNVTDRTDAIMANVDKAISQTGYLTAGVGGAVLRHVPGTEATDLKKTIAMVKANIGFQELQAMRQSSPTGGALGNVANFEIENLQSTLGSLDQDQSPAQLRETLGKVREHYNKWKATVEEANRLKWGGTSSGIPNFGGPAAPTAAPAGGATRTYLRQKYGL